MRLNLYEIYLGTLSITFPRVEPLETCKRASSRITPFLPRFKVCTLITSPLSNSIPFLENFAEILRTMIDMDLEDDVESLKRKRKEGESISLPPFGLATYKMQGDVWHSDTNGRDLERMASLSSVADSWLKQLRVQHHDFNYFMGMRHG